MSFPRYRGFNLLAKFGEWGPRAKFEEEDFEIMTDWGFDFARIPMSYWRWASKDNWFKIDEEVIKEQYKFLVSLLGTKFSKTRLFANVNFKAFLRVASGYLKVGSDTFINDKVYE